MAMADLKTCPFCESSARIELIDDEDSDGRYYLMAVLSCDGCPARMEKGVGPYHSLFNKPPQEKVDAAHEALAGPWNFRNCIRGTTPPAGAREDKLGAFIIMLANALHARGHENVADWTDAKMIETAARDLLAPLAAGRVGVVDEWAEAVRIACLDDVDEALREFAHDSTGDNGTMVVREVMRALYAGPAPLPEVVWELVEAAESLASLCDVGEYDRDDDAIDAAVSTLRAALARIGGAMGERLAR
jgi:hypothetical protein